MPEVAKCPCCGNEMLPLLTVTGCSYCAFECELKDFPRISAAMEYAKSTVANEGVSSFDEDYETNSAFVDSKDHVLEVFK